MKITMLLLDQIRIDGGTQPRVEISNDLVAEYTEQLRSGTEFPPVTTFFDGAAYWLADGFHRYHAHLRLKLKEIAAEVNKGGQREALLYAVGANAEHGQRRTNRDKHKAVVTMLTNKLVSQDANGKPLSDSEIARLCKVHQVTVGRIRKELSYTKHKIGTSRTVKRGTSVYVQNTAKIGPGKGRAFGSTSPKAFQPIRKPKPAMAKTAMELPHDPDFAARALISVMGEEFVRRLIQSLNNCLKQKG